MASDGSPILIDLLDSLSSINKRLNLIETALSVHSEGDLSVGAIQPAVPDKSPQAVAQRYGQPPPYSYAHSQSRSPPSSISPLPSYTNNTSHGPGQSRVTSAWPGQPTMHAAAPTPTSTSTSTPTHTPTPTSIPTSIPTDKKRPYAKRSSQLLRLKNVHAKDISDDGTDYEVDTSDGDVQMRDEGAEAEVEAHTQAEAEPNADEMDVEVKQEKDKQRDEEQAVSVTAPPISDRLEALPEGFIVTGRATLQEELDGWTIPRGYSMRINGTRSHGRRQKIRMVCFRGGRSRLRPKEEDDEKDVQNRRKATTDRVSKKCECPFRFELVEICPGADEYAVHYTNDDHMQHNHAAADLMLDPRARKLPAALKAEVDQWLRGKSSDDDKTEKTEKTDRTDKTDKDKKEKGWTIAKIQAELQKRGYGHVLDFDLRNRKRALLHKERLAQQREKRGESSKCSAGSVGGSSAGNTPTG